MVQRYALSSYKNFMACVVLMLKIRLLHSLEHNHLMLSNPSYFSAANCKFINYLYAKNIFMILGYLCVLLDYSTSNILLVFWSGESSTD